MFLVANAIPPLRSKERNATRPVLFKIPSAPPNGAGAIMGCAPINISSGVKTEGAFVTAFVTEGALSTQSGDTT